MGWLGRGFLVPFPSAVHAGGTPCGIEHAHSATCDDGMGSPSGGVFCGVVGPSAATFLRGCGALMEMVPYPSAGSRRGGAEWGLESGLAFVCGLGRRVTLGMFARGLLASLLGRTRLTIQLRVGKLGRTDETRLRARVF